MNDTAYVYEMADIEKGEYYDNNYNYDSQLHSCATSGYTKTANVFTTVNSSETLEAVQIDASMYAPGEYTVEIYKNLPNNSNPESGTKIDAATTTGNLPFSGKYTQYKGRRKMPFPVIGIRCFFVSIFWLSLSTYKSDAKIMFKYF